MRRAKRLYETAWTGETVRTLALEAELQLELVGSPNQLAAVTAGFSGEPAAFADPSDLPERPPGGSQRGVRWLVSAYPGPTHPWNAVSGPAARRATGKSWGQRI